ncbi:unnamed protein product [Cylicostephanus goldi]|uniref:Uncharacterized protein n=1 Tax=Cylicostephanus goldi TaxID=71465 RepID=A0A3P6T1U3_CYLGO|nr:unnamed protein product [Cylicostephanus goldi]
MNSVVEVKTEIEDMDVEPVTGFQNHSSSVRDSIGGIDKKRILEDRNDEEELFDNVS